MEGGVTASFCVLKTIYYMNITDEMSGLEALMAAAEKQNEEKKDIVEQGNTCSMDEGCISCSG